MMICNAPMWTKQCNALLHFNTLLTQTCLETGSIVLFSMDLPHQGPGMQPRLCILTGQSVSKTEHTVIIALKKTEQKLFDSTNLQKSPIPSKNPA